MQSLLRIPKNLDIFRLGDLVFQGALRILAILIGIFLLDVGLTILLKVVILGNTTISATDLLIPGFLAGAGFRLIKIAFNTVLFLPLHISAVILQLNPLLPMDLGISNTAWIETFITIISDVVLLIFEDILVFFRDYIKGFNFAEVFNRIVEMLLGMIQNITTIPVLDFFRSFGDIGEGYEDIVEFLVWIPTTIGMMITGLLLGGITRCAIDFCMASFYEYGTTSGSDKYLKGDSNVRQSDFVLLESEAGKGDLGAATTYKSFVSEEAKARWERINDGVERRPPYTTMEPAPRSSLDDPNVVEYVEVVHEDDPYVTESEKTTIRERLAKEGSDAYYFVKDTFSRLWKYRDPK